MESGKLREDPRYAQANKEALLAIGLFVLNVIWWFAFAYGLGSGSPTEYSYIMGFPAWFFWSVIGGYVVFSFLTWVMVKFFYKDMPLDAATDYDWKPKGEGNES